MKITQILIPAAFLLGYWYAKPNIKEQETQLYAVKAKIWMDSCKRTIDRVCFYENCNSALEILEEKICKVPEEL